MASMSDDALVLHRRDLEWAIAQAAQDLGRVRSVRWMIERDCTRLDPELQRQADVPPPALVLEHHLARVHLGVVECLAEITDRSETYVLVTEPLDPFGTGSRLERLFEKALHGILPRPGRQATQLDEVGAAE